MKKKILISVITVVLVLVALVGIKAMQITTLIAFGKSFVPPPETVSTATAREDKWQDTLSAVGSINAVQGVMITAEIPGTIREIAFESGAVVNQGDVLVKFDISSEEAQLRALEAQVDLAQTNLARMKSLRAENTVSQSELDQAETSVKQFVANADNLRATIAKKIIRAPFAGRLGIRQVNTGQYLEAAKPIVSLQSLTPVFGDFSLPQQDLARIKTGLQVRVLSDAYPGKTFTGTLTAINPDLDPITRSIKLQATFDNNEQLLRPGMFARMEIVFPEVKPVLAIPATAVLSAPYGDSVYVVEPSTNAAGGLVVRQQFIRVDLARGDFVSVTSGLKPGENVVSSGMFKLRNNMAVVVNNDIAPKSDKKPNPSDS
jgi:membrane fusion protein (multidrug efflux system)